MIGLTVYKLFGYPNLLKWLSTPFALTVYTMTKLEKKLRSVKVFNGAFVKNRNLKRLNLDDFFSSLYECPCLMIDKFVWLKFC